MANEQLSTLNPQPSTLNSQDTLADSEGDEPLSLDELEVENVGVPQWLQTQIVGDTLFIACDQAMLPRRLVVVSNDGECLYKLLPQEMAAITMETIS